MMGSSDQGIVRDQRGEQQPADKDRAQTAHTTDREDAVSREATRDTDGSEPKPSQK